MKHSIVLALLAALLGGMPALAQAGTGPGAVAQAGPTPKSVLRAADGPALITQDNLTKQLLKDTYETALMPVSFDEDGDVTIRETVTTYAFPNKDRVRLMSQYRFKPGTTRVQKLELANRINDDYIVVRAIVAGKNQEFLKFDYYVLVGSGISRTSLITITRRFSSIVPQAVKEHDTDDIVK